MRNLQLSDQGRWFYFRSPFPEDKDEFSEYYLVYELIGFEDVQTARMARTDIPAAPFRSFLRQHGYEAPDN